MSTDDVLIHLTKQLKALVEELRRLREAAFPEEEKHE